MRLHLTTRRGSLTLTWNHHEPEAETGDDEGGMVLDTPPPLITYAEPLGFRRLDDPLHDGSNPQ